MTQVTLLINSGCGRVSVKVVPAASHVLCQDSGRVSSPPLESAGAWPPSHMTVGCVPEGNRKSLPDSSGGRAKSRWQLTRAEAASK